MLRFNPDKRITVEQALRNPYLAQLHCPEDEPCRAPLDPSDFEFERRKIDIEALRQEIFMETLSYFPEKRAQYYADEARSGTVFSVLNFRLLAPGESQYTSEEESSP